MFQLCVMLQGFNTFMANHILNMIEIGIFSDLNMGLNPILTFVLAYINYFTHQNQVLMVWFQGWELCVVPDLDLCCFAPQEGRQI